MRGIRSLTVALALLLVLAACGEAGKAADPSSSEREPSQEISSETLPDISPEEPSSGEASPDREAIGSPAVIAYPEVLPEEVIASALCQQALTRPSVILYQQGIATGPQSVYDFLAAAESGVDGDLYCYQFDTVYADQQPYLRLCHFICDGGSLFLTVDYAESWDTIAQDGHLQEIADLALTDYGRLIYRVAGDGYDASAAVISDRDLYADAEERRQLLETYIRPIYPTGVGSNTWASPGEINNLLFLTEDICRYEGRDPWEDHGSSWPMGFILETLSRYFEDITAQDVIDNIAGFSSASPYNAQSDTFYYEGGRGGASPQLRVTGWTREGEMLLIDYACDNIDTGIQEYTRRLTVRLREDGRFCYLSNLEG